jgi:uncharacterized protein
VKHHRTEEVTTIVARHIKLGQESNFENWMHRMASAVATAKGFRGITVIAPEEDAQVRYIIYRFSDPHHLERWELSKTKNKLILELEHYATQHYHRATGMETWFRLNHHLPTPPKWKMALTAFSGVFIVGIVSRAILTPYTKTWNTVYATALYGAITVAILTWFYMPLLTKVLRKWLYPGQ